MLRCLIPGKRKKRVRSITHRGTHQRHEAEEPPPLSSPITTTCCSSPLGRGGALETPPRRGVSGDYDALEAKPAPAHDDGWSWT